MKKKTLLIILTFIISLISCTDAITINDHSKQEGIYPYELSESEENILHKFGMKDNSRIISFNAPLEAITMYVNVYSLDQNHTWTTIGGSGISIGKERLPVDQLIGNFSMIIREDYSIDCFIDCGSLVSFKAHKQKVENEIKTWSRLFLSEHKDIILGQEIPIAMMVNSSTNHMYKYTLDDYFEPSRFSNMELVQVVTITFTEDEFSKND